MAVPPRPAAPPLLKAAAPAPRPAAPPPPKPAAFEAALSHLEQRVMAFAADLLSGDTVALERDGQALRQATIDLSNQGPALQAALASGDSALRRRLHRVSKALADNRESLVRLSVVNSRMLQTLLPAAAASTYSSTPGAGLQRGRTAAAYTSKSV